MKTPLLKKLMPLLALDRETVMREISALIRRGKTVNEVAAEIGRTPRYVARLARLMRSITPEIREQVEGWGINSLESLRMLPDWAQIAVALVHHDHPELSIYDILETAQRLTKTGLFTDDELADAVEPTRRAKPFASRPSYMWRRDMTPGEKAAVAQEAVKAFGGRIGAAERLGLDTDTIDHWKSLARLCPEARAMLDAGALPMRRAVELAKMPPFEQRRRL